MSSRGFELALKSFVFRVFPAVFARLLLIQQQRGNGIRLKPKMTKDFAFYFDRWIIFPLEYLSWKIFWGLKIILWTFSRYSSCFMWNVEMGRSSGERAERFFCEAIVCCKMTAFWKDSGRLSHSKMKTTGLICWTISSFSRCYRCCFSRYYCSCPQERSVLVSGYCLYWPFTCYFCTHCSDVKNLKASVVRWTRCTKFISHVKTPFIQFLSFQRWLMLCRIL